MSLIVSGSLFLLLAGLSAVCLRAHFKYKKQSLAESQQGNYLEAEKNFVTEVLATIGSLVVVMDREGTIVRFNKACQTVTGYSLDEALGRKVWDFLLLPDEVGPVKTVFGKLTAGDFPNQHENYWVTKSGERRMLYWSNSALTDEDGKISHIIATGIDITDKRKAQTELRKTHEELEQRVEQRTRELADANKKLQLEVAGRSAYQGALQRSEKSIRELHDITAYASLPFEERVQRLLKLGCRHFGLPIGIFARISGDQYSIVAAVSPGNKLQAGTVYELGSTYCKSVLATEEPVGFEHAGHSEWQYHPAYQQFKLEAYLGARVRLADETYGTLNFSSPFFHEAKFTNGDKEFLKLMANWLGEELLRLRAEQKLRAILDSTPDAIVVVNAEGIITLANQQTESLFGYSREELLGRELSLLLPTKSRAVHKKYFSEYIQSPTFRSMGTTAEIVAVHKNQLEFPVEISLSPFDTDEGLQVSCVVRDITQRKLAEREIKRAATVFENTNEGIIIADAYQKIVAVNKAFTKITGYAEEEVLGEDFSLLHQGIDNVTVYRDQQQTLRKRGQWKGEVRNRRKDGESYPVLEHISVVKDGKGNVVNYISLFSDISAIKESEERLKYLAHHDALTNLPNRLLLTSNLENAIERARRNKQRVALLFLDLDRFKIVNDTLGHSYGDSLLQTVAKRLKKCIRREDTVARLGGDEFTIVMTEVTDAEDAAILAKKIIQSIDRPIKINDQELVTSASIGISVFPEDANDAENLIKAADTAMYYAKEQGKNNFQFYTQALTEKVYAHLSIENGLRYALANGQLELFYQPQVSLETNQIVGLEALIRWRHPEQGIISPDVFISVAEETGLINRIGEWVLRTACEQIQQWKLLDIPSVRVSVNLSGKQILNEFAIDALEKILEESGNGADSIPLDLEITESVLQSAEKSVANLTRLKSKGVRLAIDDFGTGYSSLSHIKHLPIDIIKIDRSFVHDIAEDPDDEAIASAIIAMGHSLNLRVIGEGVENQEQLRFLRRQGCDEVQGFLFSKPVPADQVPALFDELELTA